MNHILIINRYDDIFSDYKKYINHKKNLVSYITLADKSVLIEQDSKDNYHVSKYDTFDDNEIIKDVEKIHAEKKISHVIAFSEYDLDIAAKIRSKFNINGAKIDDTLLYRNKVYMKRALENTSILYPKFKSINSYEDIVNFCNSSKYPIILKPEIGAASEGIIKINNIEDVRKIDTNLDFSQYQIEEFIEGEIYHIDAIVSQNKYTYFKASKYINNCLDFRSGSPLGSVTIDNKALIDHIKKMTLDICGYLKINDSAIHLELIQSNDGFYFLEIGGRVGGGEIPFITLKNENIDLYELWIKAILKDKVEFNDHKVTGFLMVPNPYERGFYIKDHSLTNPIITYKDILTSQKRKADFSYDAIPAKIHFEGENQYEVEAAIKNCIIFFKKNLMEL